MHLQGDEQRSLGVVLVTHRCAEERQQGISGELLDVPAVVADDAAQTADDRIDDLEQVFGIEPVGKRCESGNVCEERRDEPPLFGNLASRSLDQAVGHGLGNEAPQGLRSVGGGRGFLRSSTVPAKAHAFGVLTTAG